MQIHRHLREVPLLLMCFGRSAHLLSAPYMLPRLETQDSSSAKRRRANPEGVL